MKKVLTIVLCIVLAISCIGILSACKKPSGDKHTHSYATGWTSDANYHWHKATCEHTTEISGKAAHSFNAFNKCTVCDYQGEITFGSGGIDSADAWKTAIDALNNIRNFTASISSVDASDETLDEMLIKVMENVIYQNQANIISAYMVFTDTTTTSYFGMDGLWIHGEIRETEENEFNEYVQEIFEEYVEGYLEGLADAYDLFRYDDTAKAYVMETDDDGEHYSYEVKFVGTSVYSAKKVRTDEYGNVDTYLLDAIGNTSFEIEPLHKHDYSTVYSSNNVYHWHEAVCHEGELDGKVPHSWGSDNKCTVCGYTKAAVKSTVDNQEAFASALTFKGLTNWTVTISEGEGSASVTLKRDGNKVYMESEEEAAYIELAQDGTAWQYFQNDSGAWEKVVADGSDGISGETFETMITYLLSQLGSIAELWDDMTLVDGAYTVSGCELQLYEPFDIDFENATVSVKLDDGEVIGITAKELDGDDVLGELAFGQIGSTTVTLPNATVHVHDYKVVEITANYHTVMCSCGDYDSYVEHDFDENVPDSVCSVCGAKNHDHTYNIYKPSSDTDYHVLVCECGVEGDYWNREEHDFSEGNVCSKCGAEKHEHSWVYDGYRTPYYHMARCESCGKSDSQDHDGEGITPCSICGYYEHEHQWGAVVYTNVNYHELECSICQMTDTFSHVYEESDTNCDVCGAEKHVHTPVWNAILDYWHSGYCSSCDSGIDGPHEYDDGVCTVCGAMNHDHTYIVYENDEDDVNCHYAYCECGVRSSEQHDFSESDVCSKCHAHKHVHDYQYYWYNYSDDYEHGLTCDECGDWIYEPHVDDDHDGHCDVCHHEVIDD